TVKVSSDGSTALWSTMHANSSANYGSDIIERLGTDGRYRYYVSATDDNGLFGFNDMIVYLVEDATGNATAHYTYGKISDTEQSDEISSFSGTPADGITVYGNVQSNTDFGNEYFVKAYFNGVTSCNQLTSIPSTSVYPIARITRTLTRTGTFSAVITQASILNNFVTTPLCYDNTVFNGSNARIAQQEETAEVNTVIYPNPVSFSSLILNLNLNSVTNQQIEIRVTDMLGREVLNQQINITEGKSVQQIQLPSGLSAGVYNMSINRNNIIENHRFILE
ncbi:MAG: T9SS type A sorting domain-containing protein, partial [Bacteroidia bacterium]